MSKQPSFTQLPSYKKLVKHYKETKDLHMRRLFSVEPDRFKKLSLKLRDFTLDYSKNRVTSETMSLLCELAKETQVEQWRDRMFSGEKINTTENRAVLHTALRNCSDEPVYMDGEDVMPQISRVIKQMGVFSNKIRQGKWLGYTGKRITDIVNIGIGGSDLGPQMVVQSLSRYCHKRLKIHFIANVDGTLIEATLQDLNPETTLFIISSKTFTTQETITNANRARKWFLNSAKYTKHISKHFVAVSTNKAAVTSFGIHEDNIFEIWDWVGGRYSLWSAIGLSIAVAIGINKFKTMLDGAYHMDEHFKTAPLHQNMPVIMALLGVWYNNFYDAQSHAILPYDHYLRSLPMYLEQADMESNGKSVDRDGRRVDYATGPIIWGTSGINGQHAFFQLLHQGTKMVPADFIVSMRTPKKVLQDQHDIMVANALAQTEALMRGRNLSETYADATGSGETGNSLDHKIKHMVFEGNHPTNTLLFRRLNPFSLGMLLALYEHKIFVQGIIWNLNSFDQWGVELGKQLATTILAELQSNSQASAHDSSTNELINEYKKAQLKKKIKKKT